MINKSKVFLYRSVLVAIFLSSRLFVSKASAQEPYIDWGPLAGAISPVPTVWDLALPVAIITLPISLVTVAIVFLMKKFKAKSEKKSSDKSSSDVISAS